MTQVISTDGTVLIDQLDHTPSPGEHIEVLGKVYSITKDVPVTKEVTRGPMGSKFMRVIKATPLKDSPQSASNGRRGPAIEG